jgi:sulfhydrogenase subunit alpha
MPRRNINIDYLARVEGEGGLDIVIENNQVKELRLRIFEPPRFFEGLLARRRFEEVPDIVARICGICPVSYQLAALMALEQIFGLVPTPRVRSLRRVFAFSQWIQSHALHIFMLALPDFLGYHNIFEMAQDYRPVVEHGLSLKKLGNDITAALGGREVHPVTAVIGGFTQMPSTDLCQNLIKQFQEHRQAAWETFKFLARLELPELNQHTTYVALVHPEEYALDQGHWQSTAGHDLPPDQFANYIDEYQVDYSNAFHCRFLETGTAYLVGPLARVNLNYHLLSANAREAAERYHLRFPSTNLYTSIIARALEIIHAIDTSISLLENPGLHTPDLKYAAMASGDGYAMIEAPRGTLYQHYRLDRGYVEKARIIPPTAQNLNQIEKDLRQLLTTIISLSDEEITSQCAMLVRNYDPCISCATHTLPVNIHRH